jgi:hypothetical protein
MDLKLKRSSFTENGIFGLLLDQTGAIVCFTLEHAYENGDGTWEPKVPEGTYTCLRSMHQLAHMNSPFETFEIMDVPGHTDILFHCGNTNNDSEGCVLVGALIEQILLTTQLVDSRKAFSKLMELEEGLDSFELTID